MAMSAFQILGSLAGEHGYRVIIDSVTTAGKIYFGIAKSGVKKNEPYWLIVCLDKSVNGINDFEWANREGKNNKNKIWDNRADYPYQED